MCVFVCVCVCNAAAMGPLVRVALVVLGLVVTGLALAAVRGGGGAGRVRVVSDVGPYGHLEAPAVVAPPPPPSPSPSPPPPAVLSLRIMTFNVRYEGEQDAGDRHWSARRGAVAAAIRGADPDVACLQEALFGQYEWVLVALNAAAAAAGDAGGGPWRGVFVGRDNGARAGESACILFRASRVTLVSNRTFWLSDTPDAPGSVGRSWGNVLPRICTSAVFAVAGGPTAARVAVFNTHLDNLSKVARQRGLALVMAALPPPGGARAVVCGDLNAVAGRETDTIAIATARLTDVVAAVGAGANITFPVYGTGAERGRRIDFILASPGARIGRVAIDGAKYAGASGAPVYPSDHFPVVASLEWDVDAPS